MCFCKSLSAWELLETVREVSECQMSAETQIEQPQSTPEIAPTAQLEESKQSRRGGKRSGAGRKSNLAKRLLKGFSRDAIAEAVAGVDCGAVIVGLLKSKRERTRLETLVFRGTRL